MKVLYISGLCTADKINHIFSVTKSNPKFAMQKFNRLVATGLAANGCRVKTLSTPPNMAKYPCKIVNWESETVDGVNYNYIPFINIPGIRHLCLFAYTFIYVFMWGLKNKKDKRIVCDVLDISVCIGALSAAKIIRLKTTGIVTDMPGLMVGQIKTLWGRIATKVNIAYISRFDYYVFLTQAMDSIINKRHCPYIIMEGLVPYQEYEQTSSNRQRAIVYAGGLHERYGIKNLVEGFIAVGDDLSSLHIFGDGDTVPYLKDISKKYSNIVFHGLKPNQAVVEFEKKSILLVNPRPTVEEFTKYSFPSKNMEYMLSGTPLLTTKLPGMPIEYYDYIYLIEDETADGIKTALSKILSEPIDEIISKGQRAQKFVHDNKNNIIQAAKIVKLIKD